MAEMIPETINVSEHATRGEQAVFRVLRDALQPDEDFVVWFEPTSIKKRPDFLIWSHEFGLLIVEVKDWIVNQIRSMNPKQWQVELQHGLPELRDSPVEQAHKCFIQFKKLFERNPLLCHQDPTKPGRLHFPIGYTAIFFNITRADAVKHRIVEVLKSTFCLFSDDLKFDVNDRGARRNFVAKLKSSFKVNFPFDPLTLEQFNALRHAIFPEVRIHDVRRRTAEDENLIKALDLEQERVAKSIPEGHRVLKGVAGSGKSLVLSCRAKYLAKLHPDWRILVVCYGISFSRNLRQLVAAADPETSGATIDICHYHDLVKKLTGGNLRKLSNEAEEQWNVRVGQMLLNAIALGQIRTRYDAVLIDEGQDFTVEWLQSLTSLLNPATDSLLICVDPAQNIFGRDTPYKSAGIKVQGKRPILLKRSYRNTVEILELARIFSRVPKELSDAIEEESLESLLFPMDTNRHGERPFVVKNLSPNAQVAFVLNEIERHVAARICSWCDIAVVYAALPSSGFVREFSECFVRRFGNNYLYWVTENRDTKLGLDVVSASVKLSTVESVKGMEFRIVFLLGLEQLPRPDRSSDRERKLIYVGLTRAQDILYILGNEQKGYLGEICAVQGAAGILSQTELLAPR